MHGTCMYKIQNRNEINNSYQIDKGLCKEVHEQCGRFIRWHNNNDKRD